MLLDRKAFGNRAGRVKHTLTQQQCDLFNRLVLPLMGRTRRGRCVCSLWHLLDHHTCLLGDALSPCSSPLWTDTHNAPEVRVVYNLRLNGKLVSATSSSLCAFIKTL